MPKEKNVKWKENLMEERIIISYEEREHEVSNKSNTTNKNMRREPKGTVARTQVAAAIGESSVTGARRSIEEEDTRNGDLKRKLVEIKNGTRNIYLRRGKEVLKEKDEVDEIEVHPGEELGNN